MRIKLIDTSGNVIYSDLRDNDFHILEKISKETEVISKSGANFRIGFIENKNGKVYGISDSKDEVKSSRLFLSELAAIGKSLEHLRVVKKEIEDKANLDTKRLLHNLISLNAHCIQEIYALVPQDVLASKATGHIEAVESYIVKDARSTAWTFLRLAKKNNAIKTEFSVFKNLFETTPQLSKRIHNIHKVFMNTYYTFFSDFADKEVSVNIQQSQAVAYFDYESISVALHYMIENTAKYILPKSHLQINISDSKDHAFIVFDMTSVQIKQEEITSIFEEGFSGSIPSKIGKAGSGIGMHRVAKLLNMNTGAISVNIYPDTLEKHIDIPYQRNQFIIQLKIK